MSSEYLFAEIAAYLRDHRSYVAHKSLEDALTPEFITSKAIECARLENKLVEFLKNAETTASNDVTGCFILKISYEGQVEKMCIGLLGKQVMPMPVDSIRFHTYNPTSKDHPLSLLLKKLGIRSSNLLLLGTHMDEATDQQVRDLLEKKQILASSPETLYLFDSSGKYAKVSAFPRTVIDPREDVGIDDVAIKHVLSKMTTKDFMFVFQALTQLQEKTKQFGI
ncbi:MAG TPA: hypothetical protein DEV73_03380 [Candidatus Zambryskibacteria bacterium]|uniref:Uncharacterized protein n=1 Tax=Candidatus Blackburnbacteria bacterium RIFCSPLOWO2_01_FULL_40_20 TaxID=1797519 RepID=A0A1G1VAU3_9BACT|nr:MAG: hypothetical protein A2694_03020 [Candidatus Blackburnbacteria bacterium RIFCSPHIGHO2_01_FULL_40_17]OGY09911.1 MAG: hypothetical protein A3D24_04400 [Candidatus Blackburnbacteria bacterium RIFCSPHIGHO2_02_FULL_39_13]OGY12503.1 MAG: hypothetical protein A3A77_00835 [Candidatus Blackburnbacteria bacterium RIFCSPLOWO2_01_FULL_40_20]OGY15809.1 MAG: hypothetical protein A3I52_03280 [Candidatus Blackburnbacteria bacterium RIFCSPLOWO2_02_FULL_40_10]HBL51987.1 hypothetical protein [Candidatus B